MRSSTRRKWYKKNLYVPGSERNRGHRFLGNLLLSGYLRSASPIAIRNIPVHFRRCGRGILKGAAFRQRPLSRLLLKVLAETRTLPPEEPAPKYLWRVGIYPRSFIFGAMRASPPTDSYDSSRTHSRLRKSEKRYIIPAQSLGGNTWNLRYWQLATWWETRA